MNIKFLYWCIPDFHFWCTPDFDVHQRFLYINEACLMSLKDCVNFQPPPSSRLTHTNTEGFLQSCFYCWGDFRVSSGWLGRHTLNTSIVNRPGVAGAVLQTPLYLIYSFIHWVILLFRIFQTLSIPNRKS